MGRPGTLPVTSRGDGRPVVLVHGVGGSAATSFAAAAPVLAREHHVLAVDLPSAGSWTLDDVADALAATVGERTSGPVLLLGHSLGAAVVARTAARHPDLADDVVLVAGPWRRDARLRLATDLWRRLYATDRALLARYLVLMTSSPAWIAGLSDRDVEDLVGLAHELLPTGTGVHLGLTADAEIAADLDRVTARVTAILGDEDPLIRRDGWIEAAAAGRLEALVWTGGHDVLAHHTRDLADLVGRLVTTGRAPSTP